jgi:ubiquinol-cytochrome c reductase cytochrome c1 subunit
MGSLFALPTAILGYFVRLGWVRSVALFVGIGFAFAATISLYSGISAYYTSPPVPLASDDFHREHKELALSSDGPFGKFDKAQLQRGFQVYSEVCSACHSLNFVAFRDLKQLGYNDAEIKKKASDWKNPVPSVNPDTGEAATRKPLPSDHFPSPFLNETQARAANNNALPPDLSLMTKAREGGPAYVYSLLTGYQNQPPELLKKFPDAKTPPNLHYNPYFANLNLAMPPPLKGGEITFADGTPNTLQNEARDVSAFLVWTAEPNLERRHAAGLSVSIFLLIASVLAYFAYQNVWADAKRTVRVTGALEPKNQAKTRRAKGNAGITG